MTKQFHTTYIQTCTAWAFFITLLKKKFQPRHLMHVAVTAILKCCKRQLSAVTPFKDNVKEEDSEGAGGK